MPVEMSVEEARAKLGSIVTAAARDDQVTVISKGGIPAAAVCPLRMVYGAERIVFAELDEITGEVTPLQVHNSRSCPEVKVTGG
jgi:prevent-host-death family protein